MSIQSVIPSNHHILCHPIFFLPLIFQSIRDFQMSQLIVASSPITSWQVDGNNGNSERLFSWTLKSLQMMTSAMKLKDAYSLEGKL